MTNEKHLDRCLPSFDFHEVDPNRLSWSHHIHPHVKGRWRHAVALGNVFHLCCGVAQKRPDLPDLLVAYPMRFLIPLAAVILWISLLTLSAQKTELKPDFMKCQQNGRFIDAI